MMSEIIGIDGSSDDYQTGLLNSTSEKHNGNIVQLKKEDLSPVDYETQAFLTIFFGNLGLHYFNAGHSLKGAATLITTLGLGCLSINLLPITFLPQLIHAWHLNQGSCQDSDGKLIRQVIQLKKEEISCADQGVALILNMVLGYAGGHQFYSGKTLKGVLMCITGGFCGLWTVINTYQLITCGFRDSYGKIVYPSYLKEDEHNSWKNR